MAITRLFYWFLWVFLLSPAMGQDILPAKEVFQPKVLSRSANRITLAIDIKSGYYLYRERLFSATINGPNIIIEQTTLSDGADKTDQFFGTQSVWYGGKHQATIDIAFTNPLNITHAEVQLKYQGCQDGVICYPPEKVILPVVLPVAEKTTPSGLFPTSKPSKSPLHSILGAKTDKDVLPEDKAFPFFVELTDATTLAIHWQVAEGYYLYRDKIKVTATDNTIAQIQLSEGTPHRDNFFGEQAIYRGDSGVANVYLKAPQALIDLKVSFQGCAEAGICYPIMTRSINIENNTVSTQAATATNDGNVIDRLTSTLSRNRWLGVGLLLLAGIALSFTPCVLPMLPILLGIITNQRQVSKQRAAVLSSSYAVGVASMMAVFGLVVAKTGVNIQVIFQKPLWLIIFAMIFIAMGLAMLGVFSVAVPGGVQNKVIAWQNKFQAANPLNLFVVGALSTLVVGPCIAPPLVAVLAFISTTNDSLQGALYLFALGLGMSLPLVIFATLVTAVPKTGAFSQLVTRIFAILMFGVGLWLLARLLPGAVSLVLWGVLMLGLAFVLWKTRFIRAAAKNITTASALLVTLLGAVWIVGGLSGHSNPLKPFTKTLKLPFVTVQTADELQAFLSQSDKVVMLDLYADWCVSCQELEHITFADPTVAEALQALDLVKLDITDTNNEHRRLLKQLNLIGPPALVFFKNGEEVTAERHIGMLSAPALLEKLARLRE